MACDCLRHVNDGLAKFNAHVAVALPVPGGDPQAIVETHQNTKADGAPYHLLATFCPFCGERYGHDPAIGISAAGGEVASHVH